jgi:3-oxoacyl-[acyl-carrier-protein] synthase III
MRTPGIYLRSIGVHVPPLVSVDAPVAARSRPPDGARIFRLGSAAVTGEIPVPGLALGATRQAFDRSAGLAPTDLDLLVYTDVQHQRPDGWHPQYYLQLTRGDMLAIELRHGCCGLFSAVELAASYLRAEPRRRAALLVGADNHGTPLIDGWRRFAVSGMGDGGCALLLTTDNGFAEMLAVNVAMTRDAEPDRNGTGGLIGVTKILMDLVDRTLEEAGITMSDVARVAFPRSRRDDLEKAVLAWLGLSAADATWEYGTGIGHLGVSDQFVALEHLLATGALSAGDHVLLIGLGPDITVSCAALRILRLPREYA